MHGKTIIGKSIVMNCPIISAGIYYLLLNGEVVYIGESNDVFKRVEQHNRKRLIKFNSSMYIPLDVSISERRYIEANEISIHSPKHNSPVSPTFFGYVSLPAFRLKFTKRPGIIEIRKSLQSAHDVRVISHKNTEYYKESELKCFLEARLNRVFTYKEGTISNKITEYTKKEAGVK